MSECAVIVHCATSCTIIKIIIVIIIIIIFIKLEISWKGAGNLLLQAMLLDIWFVCNIVAYISKLFTRKISYHFSLSKISLTRMSDIYEMQLASIFSTLGVTIDNFDTVTKAEFRKRWKQCKNRAWKKVVEDQFGKIMGAKYFNDESIFSFYCYCKLYLFNFFVLLQVY